MMATRILNGRFLSDVVLGGIVILALIDMQSMRASARMMPELVAWVTLGLIALDMVRLAFPQLGALLDPATPRSDRVVTEQAEGHADWGVVLRVMIYLASFWVAVLMFGFYVAPFVLVTIYLIVEARVPWYWAVLASGVASALTLYGMTVLRVSIWRGVASEIVPGFIGGQQMPLF